jgi:transcriptional regulator with XRE-family HTH domain
VPTAGGSPRAASVRRYQCAIRVLSPHDAKGQPISPLTDILQISLISDLLQIQAQLAKRLGVGQPRLADIEKHPETVSTAQLLDLFAALGVEVLLRVKPTSHPSETRSRGQW